MRDNLKYYRHEVLAHRNWKFKVLRGLYGWEGDAKFWALNSLIASSDGCKLNLENEKKREDVADELGFSLEKFDVYIDDLINKCELLKLEEPLTIWTKDVMEAHGEVSNRRERNRKYYQKKSVVAELKGRSKSVIEEKSDSKVAEDKKIISLVVEEVSEFFGFSEVSNFRQIADIRLFAIDLNSKGHIDHFRKQFSAYIEYKQETGEKMFSFKNFIDPYHPLEGAWNMENWSKKLLSLHSETDYVPKPTKKYEHGYD